MRIVVVGAGTGGTLVANLLADELKAAIKRGEASVTISEPRAEHNFQPGSLDAAFRGTPPERFLRPTEPLLGKGVVRVGGAKRIDVEGRQVLLEGGEQLPYDRLIIATGSVGVPSLIPGLDAALTFHQGPEEAHRIWEALERLESGRIVIAITEMPYKCPPSPNEACFLADEYLRKRGIRDKVSIKMLTPMPRAYPAEAISQQVEERFKAKGIELGTFWMTDHVEDGHIVNMEGEKEPFDVLIAIPPHRGAPIIEASDLGDAEGWVQVDKGTMRVKGHPEIYALGDCTALPISKSGVVAHLQATVVAKNILADIQQTPSWTYNGRINCPMEVGDHRLLWVSATYDAPPKPNRPTMVKYAMKKAFGRMYWRVLSGDLEWMFHLYFGKTDKQEQLERGQVPANEP